MKTDLAILKPIKDLAESWRVEGIAEFDKATTPVQAAEASRQLKCALKLRETLERAA